MSSMTIMHDTVVDALRLALSGSPIAEAKISSSPACGNAVSRFRGKRTSQDHARVL
jgi:hypothetical protein